MAQIFVFGRVMNDLVPKESQSKVYWPRLAEVLESNGLAAEVTAQGIQVSW